MRGAGPPQGGVEQRTLSEVTVLGGGLAGCEAALALADGGAHGIPYGEMRPRRARPRRGPGISANWFAPIPSRAKSPLREGDPANFQPMKWNWELVEPLAETPGKIWSGEKRLLLARIEFSSIG